MKAVSLQIDGKEVSAAQGTTIFEAAKSAGIEIPHLCYWRGLSPTGACRLCLVEIRTFLINNRHAESIIYNKYSCSFCCRGCTPNTYTL